MWLSTKLTAINKNNRSPAFGDITQTQASVVCVQSACEHREIPIIAPFGIAYAPLNGENCVILPVTSGNVCLGVKMPDKGLSPGEIMLYSGQNASIVLKNDGTININGNVKINGKVV